MCLRKILVLVFLFLLVGVNGSYAGKIKNCVNCGGKKSDALLPTQLKDYTNNQICSKATSSANGIKAWNSSYGKLLNEAINRGLDCGADEMFVKSSSICRWISQSDRCDTDKKLVGGLKYSSVCYQSDFKKGNSRVRNFKSNLYNKIILSRNINCNLYGRNKLKKMTDFGVCVDALNKFSTSHGDINIITYDFDWNYTIAYNEAKKRGIDCTYVNARNAFPTHLFKKFNIKSTIASKQNKNPADRPLASISDSTVCYNATTTSNGTKIWNDRNANFVGEANYRSLDCGVEDINIASKITSKDKLKEFYSNLSSKKLCYQFKLNNHYDKFVKSESEIIINNEVKRRGLDCGIKSNETRKVVKQSTLPNCPKSGYKQNCYGSILYAHGGKYNGEWKNNFEHGFGEYAYSNGDKYVGNFKYGKKEGKGTFYFIDGSIYVGNYKDDQMNGKGSLTNINKEKYLGNFKENKKHGKGIIIKPNGSRKEVTYNYGFMNSDNKKKVKNKLADTSEEILCFFATVGYASWDLTNPNYVNEAKRRGIDCGINNSNSEVATSKPKKTKPSTSFQELEKEKQKRMALQRKANDEERKRKELEKRLALLEKKQKEQQQIKPKTIVSKKQKSEFPLKPIAINFPSASIKRDDIAVIIGNANYKKQGKDIPNVNPAYADAEGIKQYFMKAKGVREGNIIYLKDATNAQLLSVFGNDKSHKGKLFNYIKPNKSNVYIYYAGHGAPGKEGDAFLVPTDTDSQTIEFTGYPLSTLYSNLGKLPAKSMTVILEACFSGGSQSGSLISRASPIIIQPKKTFIPNNIKVIAAGSERQMASWEEDSSHSLFTKYFLKAMSGEGDANKDGNVSDKELKDYLSDTMTYLARRYYGRDQKVQIHNGG